MNSNFPFDGMQNGRERLFVCFVALAITLHNFMVGSARLESERWAFTTAET